MRRRVPQTVIILLIASTLLLLLGCGKTRNLTTAKGAGGLPVQQYDSSQSAIPWEVPPDLLYPGAKQRYPDNNRIFTTSDGMDAITTFLMEHMPEASREDAGPKVRRIKSEDLEVELEDGGGTIVINYKPLNLLGKKKD